MRDTRSTSPVVAWIAPHTESTPFDDSLRWDPDPLGDATLSVADPSPNATGHLVNGTFSLPQALQAKASSVSGTGGAYSPVGGSTTLLTYGGPVSNDGVTLNFKQPIATTDPLRTGTYGKTLTFTLSTTTP